MAQLMDIQAFNYLIMQGTTREAYKALQDAFPELNDISSMSGVLPDDLLMFRGLW